MSAAIVDLFRAHMKNLIQNISAVCFACILVFPSIGNAQTCRVYCPDGSSHIVDCSSNTDPCAGDPGGYVPPPPYTPPPRDYEAERRQQLRDEAFAANENGIQFYLNGDWEKAVAAFEEAASKNPDDVNIRQNLTNAKAALQKQQEELRAKKQAKDSADKMHQSIQKLAHSLPSADVTPLTGELDFAGGNVPAPSVKGNGLDFTQTIATPSRPLPGEIEKKRLIAREQQITAAIAKDVKAIQNLGFARRAEDFAEWEQLGADAKAKFEKEIIDAATEQIAGKVSDHLIESFKHFDATKAGRWVGVLEKVDPKPVELIKLVQQVAHTADKAKVAEQARLIVQGIERIQQARAAQTREDLLLVGLDLICDVVPPPGDASCNAFKSTSKATVASLYNNAARRVAINEVERLTTMTEAQLRGLAKINEVMVKHVKERNEVRAKLKALE